jgi:hypothetical protein
VSEEQMHLLDSRRRSRRHDDGVAGEGAEPAAIAAGEGDGDRARALAARRPRMTFSLLPDAETPMAVAAVAQGFDLAGKQIVEAEVVADGGERRRLGGRASAAIARRFVA